MKKVGIRGITLPVITPMSEDEVTSKGELGNQVNRQINEGVYELFPFGTSGEGYILGKAEKEQVLSIVVDETRGCISVCAGTGCISTRDTIRQSGMIRSLGADVLSITTPSFAAASQSELCEHYKAMVEAVGIPTVLYNISAETGSPLAPATTARLNKIKDIMGAEGGSGDFDSMLQYIGRTRESSDFVVLSGDDSLILWNLLAGGADGIAGCMNVFPEVATSIYDSFAAGDLEGAGKTRGGIRPFRVRFKYGNPNTIVETAVALLGYPVGKCCAPFSQVPEEEIEVSKEVLTENHERGMCWWGWRNV